MRTLHPPFLAALFACVAASPTAAWPQSLSFGAEVHLEGRDGMSTVVGDFDGDGVLDLAHSFLLHYWTLLRVERGDGAGGYTTHFEGLLWGESIGLRVHLAPGDFDGDGDLDLIASHLHGWVELYRNDGAGRFSVSPPSLAFLGPIGWISAHDVDGDGALDLALGTFHHEAGVSLGRGDGTFEPVHWLPAPYRGADLEVVDLDGDGRVELVLAEGAAQRATVFERTPAGTYFTLATLPLGVRSSDVLVADFDADGRMDLVFGAAEDDAVIVVRNLGGLTFGVSQQFAVGDNPARLAAADLDGDGTLDLAVTERDDDTVATWLGIGDGTFHVGERYAVGTRPSSLLPRDHDFDGDLDLLVAQERGGAQRLLRNRGDGTFAATDEAWLELGGVVHSVGVGDVDGDGRPDVVGLGRVSGDVHVFVNQGARVFAPLAVTTTGVRPGRLVLVDVDGDMRLDAVVSGPMSGGLVVLFGCGDGRFEPPTLLPLGNDSVLAAHADFDGDGRLDFAVTTAMPPFEITHEVHIVAQVGPRVFNAALPQSFGTAIDAVSAADIDVDGSVDLVVSERAVSHPWGQWLRVLHGRGDGTFIALAPQRTPEPGGISTLLGDFDGDGRVDLVTATAFKLWLRPHVGRVSFSEGTFVRSQSPNEHVAWGDVDGDGHADLMLTHSRDGTVSVARGDGTGRLGSPVTIGFGHEPQDVHAVDLDADGLPDLVGWEQDTRRILVRFNGVR